MTMSTGVPVAMEMAEFPLLWAVMEQNECPLWPLPHPTQFTAVCGVVASGAF
jgi:hypothetical protein